MTDVVPTPPMGLKLKLRRARKHLRFVRRSLERWVATDPVSYRREINEEGTHYLYRMIIQPGPESVELVADEAIHHLRSILDHLVTALIEARGLPSSGRRFPIFDKEPRTAKEQRSFNDCIDGLSALARDLVVSLQPYKRGDDAHTHPLWILNRLDNRLKHTTLHLLSFTISAPELPGVVKHLPGTVGRSGDVFATVPIHLNVKEDFEPFVSVHVGFRETRIGIRGVGLDTLDEIYEFIRDEVLRKTITTGPWPRRLIPPGAVYVRMSPPQRIV